MGFLKSRKFFFIVMFITFSFTIFYIYRYFFFRFNERAELGHDFVNEVHQSVINYGEVNFDTITTFEWDTLLIIFPYTNPKQVFQEEGFRWRRIRSSIKSRDDFVLAIFLNDNRIVHYFEYSRSLGDLMCYRPTSFQGYSIFSREDAIFYLDTERRPGNNLCLIPASKSN